MAASDDVLVASVDVLVASVGVFGASLVANVAVIPRLPLQ